jgi:glyoxylase-like metal-dependent hydrolase (beta-lactamase superfamily II)
MALDHTLSALLADLGYSASDVGTALVSHLHGDHIGGPPEPGQAELLVSRAEWHTFSGLWPELLGVMCKRIKLRGLRPPPLLRQRVSSSSPSVADHTRSWIR